MIIINKHLNPTIISIIVILCFQVVLNNEILDNTDINSSKSIESIGKKFNQLNSVYKSNENRFLFIVIDKSIISLEYFQLLIEEFLMTNSEYSLSFKHNEETLILVVKKKKSVSADLISSVFTEYIKEIYIQDS